MKALLATGSGLNSLILALVVIAIILVLVIIASGYVKAPPDKAFIISGMKREPKILIGRAGIKLPFFERKDTLVLKQISIDIKTNGYVPTLDFIGVDIDAVAKVRVKTDPEGIKIAMKNFLNMDEPRIIAALTDSLQGNMREIIGTVKLKELNTDRKKFGDEVQEKAQKDMNALGIEIISCNIQKIEDEKGLIIALGQDNMSQIQKDASIAKAQADKDVAIAEAEAKRLANEAQVKAETEIASKQNELRIRQAELKRESDIKQAEADAAYEIQQQEQRKTIEITTANANIARQEREIELKKKDVEVTEQTLEADIKKRAEAEKFARQQKAEAELFERQRKAEAEKFEKQKAAEAAKIKAEADLYAKTQEAEGIRAVGEAEAKAIEAKGIAEAEALEKKAEAMKKYGQAAMIEMIVKALPDMASAIAKPLENIDKVTIFDSGNGESGVGNVGSYVPNVLAKTMETVKEVTGLDIVDIMKAQTYDAKVTRNINISGLPEESGDAAKAVATQAAVKAATEPEETTEE
ncbi:MAG: flotillin family protein [Lachnospiraceae bacterium]|nr:flotillin family protein [Lachnospiraceae bacterium]